MTTKTKIVVGAVAAVAAAFLAWQISKRGGDGPKDETAAGKTVAAGAKNRAASRGVRGAKPAALSGIVTAADSKQGVAAVVQISSIDESSEQPKVARAGADGRFSFSDLAPGSYRVSASLSGYLPALSAELELDSGASETVDLALKKGGHPVVGTISDISGGPVAMAFVRLTPIAGILDARHDRAFSTLTDAEGKFTTTAANGAYILSAHHPDYVPRARRVEISGGTKELKLELVPGGVIEGVVLLSGSRRPIADAVVRYQRETVSGGFGGKRRQVRDSGRVVSDSNGKFRITGAGAGLVVLSATAEKTASRDTITVPIGIAETVTGVELFVDDAFRISGTVIDKGGIFVTGAAVTVGGEDDSSGGVSGEAGAFSIGPFTAGKYTLMAVSEGILIPGTGVDVEIKDRNVDGIELVTDSASLVIRGRVEPAVDADVSVAFDKRSASMTLLASAHTDDAGAFELGPVQAGQTVPLRAVSSDGRLGEVEVKVGADGADNVVIALKDAASVSGLVVDQDGKPIPSSTVALRPKRGGESRMVMINGAEVSARRAVSAPDGSFTVRGLEAGNYAVTVKNDRGQTLIWAKPPNKKLPTAPLDITLGEREAKTGLMLAVDAPNEEIRGRVLGPDGKPAADAFVTASPAFEFSQRGPRRRPEPPETSSEGNGEREERTEMVMMVRTSDDGALGGGGGITMEQPPVVTDDEGRFVIKKLRKGKYDIAAEGLRGTARAFATKVETGSDVTIKLQSLTSLEGVVTRDGEPIEDFDLELSGPTEFARAYSDKEGAFTVRRLDPGQYTLKVRGGGGETEMPVEVTAGKATKVEVVLKGQVKVSGKLVDAQGAPIPDAMVVLSPRSEDDGDTNVSIRLGGGSMPPRTDEGGAFVIRTLPGPFTLIALKPGQGPLAMKPITVADDDLDIGELVAEPPGAPEPE